VALPVQAAGLNGLRIVSASVAAGKGNDGSVWISRGSPGLFYL
jgi:hypothetical protein